MIERRALSRAIHFEGGVSRRLFMSYLGSLAAIPLLRGSERAEQPDFDENPFSLGVASGEPDHQSVVLWTRLCPRPLEPGGGMPRETVEVTWEVGVDDQMRRIVASGSTYATPQLGHSVHVTVDRLDPNTWYWFRFRCGNAESVVGRTRTFPRSSTDNQSFRFAFASCQNYEQGHFTAYKQMLDDDVDLVVHLGDYIYEYETGRSGDVRHHVGGELETLDDYRIRYAQYRLDSNLQSMHAHSPWLVTWDDHEFDNNYAGLVSEQSGVAPEAYLSRRANAYQAFYEMMPLRVESVPRGPDMRIYRKLSIGQLADIYMLDTRQYRMDQPNNDVMSPLNADAYDPSRTMLGRRQRNWLCGELIQSHATWNVLGQQVMMAQVGFIENLDELTYSMDQWPGYSAERATMLEYLSSRSVPNPVVLTGDIHSNWVNDLRVDDRQSDMPVIATEFVGTSISSGGNGTNRPTNFDQIVSDNPGVQFYNRERGYVLCTLTPQHFLSDYRVIDDVLQLGGTVQTRAKFVVEAGKPGAVPG